MLPVEQPFKTYTGLDGKPLDNGFVYFGQPNQDPIAHPVTVFWDAAGTIPAAQPLRTVNGYIMNAGTPANVFFDGAYSELVQDAKGRQVFYARTSDDFSISTLVLGLAKAFGSSLMGFIQAGVSAVKRTVQDKLRERVSVFDFLTPDQIAAVQAGAGAMDVTDALQAAINAVQAVNGVLEIPVGVFPFNKTLVVSKRLTIRGAGMGNPTPGATDSAGTVLKKTADCIGILVNSGANFASFENFALFGTAATGVASGIQNGQTDATNGAGGTTFRNLWIQGHKGFGLNITNGNSGRLDKVYAQGNGSHGVNISSTQTAVDNTNAWVITGVTGLSNGGDGLHLDKAVSCTVIGFDCEGNTGYGLYVNRPYNFINGYVEANTAGPLFIGGSAFNNVIFLRSVAGTPTINNGNNYIHMLDGTGKMPQLNPLGFMNYNASVSLKRLDVAWAGFISMQSRDANEFAINVTGVTNFTIGAFGDSAYTTGQRMTITIINSSGGAMGVITWPAAFKMAPWVNPANGYSRSIDVINNGTNWVEVSRTPADVPN